MSTDLVYVTYHHHGKECLQLNDHGLKRIPNEVLELKDLQILDVENNKISFVDDETAEMLGNLEALILAKNHLHRMPRTLSFWRNLQLLDLSHNKLTHLPSDGWRELASLKTLDLRNNSLSELPDEMYLLPSLEFLQLDNNRLSQLKESMANWKYLMHLSVCENLLTKLPDCLGFAGNHALLKVLRASGNQLTSLPASFDGLEKLEILHLDRNQLCILPTQVYYCRCLVELGLAHNHIEDVLPEIGRLKELKILSLQNNALTSLPEEIGLLEQLQYLDIDKNPIHRLNDSLLRLSRLRELSASECGLDEVRDLICYCSSLRMLNLTSNDLIDLPVDFKALRELLILCLSNNPLHMGLPLSVCALESLNVLELSNCQLCCLPLEMFDMENLQQLDISHNRFKDFPSCLPELPKLKYLNMSHNELYQVPENLGVMGRSLCSLNLSNNCFLYFPKCFYGLPSLTELNMSDNRLTGFPDVPQELLQVHAKEAESAPAQATVDGPAETNPPPPQNPDAPQFPVLPWEKLNLSHNHFATFPGEFLGKYCHHLHELHYNQNRGTPLKDLTETDLAPLVTNNSLVRLALSGNELRKLPEMSSFGTMLSNNLTWLDVSYNFLRELPDSLVHCHRLQEIDARFNKLRTLPRGLKNMTNLQHLRLEGNPLALPPATICAASANDEEPRYNETLLQTVDSHVTVHLSRNDKQLEEMCKIVVEKLEREEFRHFFRKLRVSDARIQAIETEFKGKANVKVRNEKALQAWREELGVRATCQELVRIAKLVRAEDIYKELRAHKVVADRPRF